MFIRRLTYLITLLVFSFCSASSLAEPELESESLYWDLRKSVEQDPQSAIERLNSLLDSNKIEKTDPVFSAIQLYANVYFEDANGITEHLQLDDIENIPLPYRFDHYYAAIYLNWRNDDYDAGERNISKAIQTAQEIESLELEVLARTWGVLSSTFQRRYVDAVQQADIAHRISQSIDSKIARIEILNALVQMYRQLKEYDRAQSHTEELIKIQSDQGNMQQLASLHYNLAELYVSQSFYEKAIEAHQLAIHFATVSNDPITAIYSHSSIASIHLRQNNPEKALAIFNQVISSLREHNMDSLFVLSSIEASLAALQLKQYDSAKAWLKMFDQQQLEKYKKRYPWDTKLLQAQAEIARHNQQWTLATEIEEKRYNSLARRYEFLKERRIQEQRAQFEQELNQVGLSKLQEDYQALNRSHSQLRSSLLQWQVATAILLTLVTFMAFRLGWPQRLTLNHSTVTKKNGYSLGIAALKSQLRYAIQLGSDCHLILAECNAKERDNLALLFAKNALPQNIFLINQSLLAVLTCHQNKSEINYCLSELKQEIGYSLPIGVTAISPSDSSPREVIDRAEVALMIAGSQNTSSIQVEYRYA